MGSVDIKLHGRNVYCRRHLGIGYLWNWNNRIDFTLEFSFSQMFPAQSVFVNSSGRVSHQRSFFYVLSTTNPVHPGNCRLNILIIRVPFNPVVVKRSLHNSSDILHTLNNTQL